MAWDYFVILGAMRTGSNFLEANLNEYPGLSCLGELYNPHFIGGPNRDQSHGMSLAEREADPMALIARIRAATRDLFGFRLFYDHDPRVIEAVLRDRRVAKIVLSRSAVETYVSLKIAGETGQWRLGDHRHARSAKIRFDEAEFAAHYEAGRSFGARIQRQLQETGQTAFFLDYADVGEVEVMNGLVQWLGLGERRDATSGATKKQNPEPLEERVTNPDEMLAALARVDRFDLGAAPMFEPRRGGGVPGWIAAAKAPLLFLPIRSGPEAAVSAWLAALDAAGPAGLVTGMNQKVLRQWHKEHPGHRSFTVLRHPLLRLHAAFCRHILPGGAQPYAEIREVLMRSYKLPLTPGAASDPAAHSAAFKGFLRFVQGNLGGQTSIRVDGAWASQLATIQGFSQIAPPDHILREDDLADALPELARSLGFKAPPWRPPAPETPLPLATILDDELVQLARQAASRDYQAFGFKDLP